MSIRRPGASIRRPGARRAAVAVLAPLTVAGILVSAGPAAAIPFEGTPDPSRCEQLLTRAEAWPGVGPGNTRLVSDGYVSYLATRPDCTGSRT